MDVFTNHAAQVLLHVLCKVAPADDITRRVADIAADFRRFTHADIAQIFAELDADILNRVYRKILKNKCTAAPWCICELCVMCQDTAELQLQWPR